MRIEAAPWDDPDVQRLAADQQGDIRARYGGEDEPGRKPSAADVSVVLVSARTTGRRWAAVPSAIWGATPPR
ncbi:hypothetical protein [Blastococcus sp. PRF04-17]|uniref:hypothetical protein n=1 Tax=Blastococcus sp. PRF04-17 TaxID=2933797 RepID=UPI001FF52FD4|nr:hypothetical protein [Blastococcus sp. PRF04-17]UOY00527.1 hypothetical protein MVA48_16180 [Blastococcus sp. PRF04-17]